VEAVNDYPTSSNEKLELDWIFGDQASVVIADVIDSATDWPGQ